MCLDFVEEEREKQRKGDVGVGEAGEWLRTLRDGPVGPISFHYFCDILVIN